MFARSHVYSVIVLYDKEDTTLSIEYYVLAFKIFNWNNRSYASKIYEKNIAATEIYRWSVYHDHRRRMNCQYFKCSRYISFDDISFHQSLWIHTFNLYSFPSSTAKRNRKRLEHYGNDSLSMELDNKQLGIEQTYAAGYMR